MFSSQNIIPNKQSHVPHSEQKQQLTNHPAESSKQHFEDLLTCHVCFCQVNSPMMCPYCSKLYCEACIRRCLSLKPECPHCRKQIKGLSMMANCNRFVSQLKNIVNDLIDYRQKQEICQQHSIKIDYYCENCAIPVCCQCQMFGSHKQHTLQKIHIIYQTRYNILRQMLTEFKTKLKEKQLTVKEVETELQELRKLKQKHLKQLEEFAESYRVKIIQETNNQAAEIQNSIRFYDNLLSTLEQLEGELNQKAQQAEKNGKYSIEEEFLNRVQEITEQQVHPYQPPKSVIEEVIPPFFQSKFILANFSKKKREKSIVYSPVQKHEGSQWRLKIYPNGNQTVEGGYLSIFIEMVSTIHQSTVYEYQIQIVNRRNTNQRMIREYQSNFQPKQSWGYNKYIKLQNLIREGYVDPISDELEIHYYIRNPFYHNIYKQKQSYITHLDSQIAIQEQQIRQLEALLGQNNKSLGQCSQ